MYSLVPSVQTNAEEAESDVYLKICETQQNDITVFLKDARKHSVKADVYFQIFNENSSLPYTVLSAHKEVLAAASPYLAELLLGASSDCDIHISFSEFKYKHVLILSSTIYF